MAGAVPGYGPKGPNAMRGSAPPNMGGLASLPYSLFRNNGPLNMGQPMAAMGANGYQAALAALLRALGTSRMAVGSIGGRRP